MQCPLTEVYTFRLESGAGLYDEQSFEATILNSDFEISIDPYPEWKMKGLVQRSHSCLCQCADYG